MISSGWRPDLPDGRDYGIDHELVASKLATDSLPSKVDLSQWCTPIENQGRIGSCTAHAGTNLLEWHHNKKHGEYKHLSRLFLYKASRKLLHMKGDTGAYLRGTIGAMTIFGVCPEEYYPYDVTKFDDELDAFCMSYAKKYQALKYFRVDKNVRDRKVLLDDIKKTLVSQLPMIFGFTTFPSLKTSRGGLIPVPSGKERATGGHAVMCVGYDDSKQAFNFENSWGRQWGENGFGWLPYEYVLRGMTADWWAILDLEWLDTDEFRR